MHVHVVGRHHAEIDTADLRGCDRDLKETHEDQAPAAVVRPQQSKEPLIRSRGLLVQPGQDPAHKVGPGARLDRSQLPALHGRADEPGAASAARFQMQVDLLRKHLWTLAVKPRRQRFARNVTPHPCIVAHARPPRKELGRIELS
jgi:hypothetical protein